MLDSWGWICLGLSSLRLFQAKGPEKDRPEKEKKPCPIHQIYVDP